MDKQGKVEPYLMLKFGDIKGADFTNNPEASKVFTEKRILCKTDEDYKSNTIEIIDLFTGDIIKWWGSVKMTKEEAKEYVLNYKDT